MTASTTNNTANNLPRRSTVLKYIEGVGELKAYNGHWEVRVNGEVTFTATHWLHAKNEYERISSKPLNS